MQTSCKRDTAHGDVLLLAPVPSHFECRNYPPRSDQNQEPSGTAAIAPIVLVRALPLDTTNTTADADKDGR